MITTQAPVSLTQERFAAPAKRRETPPAGLRFAAPPIRSSGAAETPRNANPQWLADKIKLNRRAARPDTCRKCDANILVGPDHDTVAATARVDPEPVDRITEVIALLAGRQSYDQINSHLHIRWAEHHHSSNRPHPVLLTHVCTATDGRLF